MFRLNRRIIVAIIFGWGIACVSFINLVRGQDPPKPREVKVEKVKPTISKPEKWTRGERKESLPKNVDKERKLVERDPPKRGGEPVSKAKKWNEGANLVRGKHTERFSEVAKRSAGSTGRKEPANIKEQMAMKFAKENPTKGTPILMKEPMKDPRWKASDGWVKMKQNIEGVEIHYVRNTKTGEVDDFKFPNQAKQP